jgi:hypothetical protein
MTLSSLCETMQLELKTVESILDAHYHVQFHDFQQCVLSYFGAKSGLQEWIDIEDPGLGSRTGLVRFLQRLMITLHAKIGICFHKVITTKDVQLLHSTQPKVRFHDEIRAAYLEPLLSVFDSLKPMNVCILHIPPKNQTRFRQGFECEGTDFVLPAGIHSFPPICSFPMEVLFVLLRIPLTSFYLV